MDKVRNVWVYDIETIKNFFCVVWLNIDSKELVYHEISEFVNDHKELKRFVKKRVKKGIGYNNNHFDNPVLDDVVKRERVTPEYIYAKSQKVINNKYNNVYDPVMKQIDLFRIWHYNNKNKSCSLKKLQINLDLPNVEDMPYPHDKPVTREQASEIRSYCENDVLSTYAFYEKSVGKIRERQEIKKKTGIDCINFSDTSLGEALVLKYYCDEFKLDPKEVKQRRTIHESVDFNEIVLPHIHYTTPGAKRLLNNVRSTTLKVGNDFCYSSILKNIHVDMKLGGLHGAYKGNFFEDEEYCIIDSDVAGLYPRIYTYYNFRPAHLPGFNRVVEPIYEQRIEAKGLSKDKSLSQEERNYYKMLQGMLKLALNSIYGKFNDQFSFLYDYKTMLSVTINGQLLIIKWIESLIETIPSLMVLQANTDGCTFRLKRSDVELFYEMCEAFQTYSGFVLEHQNYKRISIRDVNTYCALDMNDKLKVKGEYVYEIGDEFHKKYDFRVSRKAAVDYLMFDKPIKETIHECKNFYHFMGSERFKKKESFGYWLDNNLRQTKTQENVRYYASNTGRLLKKFYHSGKSENTTSSIESGQTLTECNKIIENKLPPNLDYQFYYNYARQLANATVMYDKKNKTDRKGKGTLPIDFSPK